MATLDGIGATIEDSAAIGRRGRILADAARLFADRGIAATSIRDIADAVGIRSASLYHHFTSKEQIVREILAAPVLDLSHRYDRAIAAGADPLARLRGLIEASFATLIRMPDACAIYQHDYGLLATMPAFEPLLAGYARFQEVWLTVLQDGAAAGQFRGDVPALVFYRLCRDAVWSLVGPYRRGEVGHDEIEALTQTYTDLLLNGHARIP